MSWRLAGLLALVTTMALPVSALAEGDGGDHGNPLRGVQHIVVIYEENHSFDNLYGGWEGVNGLANAKPSRTIQINQAGTPYICLLQNDVNLTTVASVPPGTLPVTCTEGTTVSDFVNAPFKIDTFIPSSATTCPAPGAFYPHGVQNGKGLPGGCTADIVHRFYQEQYQLNGGQQNRYVTGSDAVGLAMGYYDTTALPIYSYLHQDGHPGYAIADNFFQAAFGGSFLNHQWLIAAQTPVWVGALNDGSPNDLHSVVDANGMPNNYVRALQVARGRHGPRQPADRLLLAGTWPRADTSRRAVWRLRDQHHSALLPAIRARYGACQAAAATDDADHRRPAQRERRGLGLVLRRLVQRQR
jgi:phospholipase C